jgi:transcriptional antiterminator Rof (Rho-off)
MNVEEIEQQALALSDGERATLVARRLHTLPPVDAEISDSEVEQRECDLDSGKVTTISHNEFVRRVQEERGR